MRPGEIDKLERDPNDPARFYELDLRQQSGLVQWIQAVLVKAKTVFSRSSYDVKHDFEREPDGFYVYNGAFKGAMVAAGFYPVYEREMNWRFRVKPSRRLSVREKAERHLSGAGQLARSGREACIGEGAATFCPYCKRCDFGCDAGKWDLNGQAMDCFGCDGSGIEKTCEEHKEKDDDE